MVVRFVKAMMPVAALFLTIGGAEAQQVQGRDIQVASGHLTAEQVVDRVFTNVERRVFQRYYEARGGSNVDDGADHGDKHKNKGKHQGKGKGKNNGMPPGLAKRGGDLPPGLAKRGGTLPPGLAKRLPSDLDHQLPPRPRTYQRVIVDNDIVLIDAATNKVLDVIENVLLGR